MSRENDIEMGLNGDAPLKVIVRGTIIENQSEKVGVVSVVFATMDKDRAKTRIYELIGASPSDYYMVYSVPLDTDLARLHHFPSVAITKEDLS